MHSKEQAGGTHRGEGGAHGRIGRQRLDNGQADALAFEVPLGDLVVRVVAQGVEDGAPALVAEVVAAEVHLCTAHKAVTNATTGTQV